MGSACRKPERPVPEAQEKRSAGEMGKGRRPFLRCIVGGFVGETLGTWGSAALVRRSEQGGRSAGTEASMWRLHVLAAPLGAMALEAIRRPDLRAWIDELGRKTGPRGLPLSAKFIRECLVLVRVVLEDACERGLIASNPARGMRTGRLDEREEPVWTYLEPDEQVALCECEAIAEPDRLRIGFAIFGGLRRGEQWTLGIDDCSPHAPRPFLDVTRGGPGRSRKNRKRHRLYLNPTATRILARQLELVPSYCPSNPRRLVFPTPRGAMQQTGGRFHAWWRGCLRAAGIARHVRWHDLRHTKCSALVAGMWGRRWTLPEVRECVGHLSVRSTDRYVHLAPSRIAEYAAETPGLAKAAPARSYRLWLGLEDLAHVAAAGALMHHYAAVDAAELAAFESMHELLEEAAKDAEERMWIGAVPVSGPDAALGGRLEMPTDRETANRHARSDSNGRLSGSKPEGHASGSVAAIDECRGAGCAATAPSRAAVAAAEPEASDDGDEPPLGHAPEEAPPVDDRHTRGVASPVARSAVGVSSDAWTESAVVRRGELERPRAWCDLEREEERCAATSGGTWATGGRAGTSGASASGAGGGGNGGAGGSGGGDDDDYEPPRVCGMCSRWIVRHDRGRRGICGRCLAACGGKVAASERAGDGLGAIPPSSETSPALSGAPALGELARMARAALEENRPEGKWLALGLCAAVEAAMKGTVV